MVNGLFLDNLERDLELVNHMNSMAQMLPTEKKRILPGAPFRRCIYGPVWI